MNRIMQTTLFLTLFIACFAFAQVTIVTSDLAIDHGTTIQSAKTEDDYVTVDLGSAGANQTWDFSGIVTDDPYTIEWMDPVGTSGFADFPNATSVCEIGTAAGLLFYWETTTSNHLRIGVHYPPMSIPYNNTVTPDNFPLNYQDTWMQVIESQSFVTGDNMVDTLWGEVDGWGTLVDVTGSHSCLRLQHHYRSWTMDGGTPVSLRELYYYEWLVPGGAAQVHIESEDGQTNPNFTMGSFHRTTSIVGIQELPGWTAMPTEVTLQPAFPNPFNPETNLTFSLPMAGDVSLSIYDSQGRMVTNLQNGFMTPGSYQANFSADHLSSGTYFARLTSGSATQMQKLVLVK